MTRPRLVIVDDEPAIRFALRDFLESRGFEVAEAGDCREARELFRTRPLDAVILDYSLPDGNALDLLPLIQREDPGVPAIILTAHGSIDLAVRAIKEGAEHFVTKPVELSALAAIIDRVLANRRARKELIARRGGPSRSPFDPFLGTSAVIRQLAEEARQLLSSESPVLITGETGTGKGVLAAWIHAHGPRAEEAFVDVNCAGLSREFLESDLFGHEKGAYTGAGSAKPGLLEAADRGTLFLDEIGDMDLEVQARLLKVLEEKRFRRLGEIRDRYVDVRLIAATHQDLGALVRDKRFRSDLYYRVNTLPLRMPALRERLEDLPLLARRLIADMAAGLGRRPLEIPPPAETALRSYCWPGNLRELRNVLDRAVLLSSGDVLDVHVLRFDASGVAPDAAEDSAVTLDEMQKRHIERALAVEGGSVERAAVRLGVPRSTLYQMLKRFGIER